MTSEDRQINFNFRVKKHYRKKTPSTHNKVKDVSPEQIRVAIISS